MGAESVWLKISSKQIYNVKNSIRTYKKMLNMFSEF